MSNSEWMKLDNAAKIYPATMRRKWTALFRLSAELTEPIDPGILALAQKRTLKRFVHFNMRLKRGAFWYYLECSNKTPEIENDVNNPCVRMRLNETEGCMFRIRYYDKRIAVEIFHVLADGTGGLCFLKTLLAEYVTLKYNVVVPRDDKILDCDAPADPENVEDAFFRFARDAKDNRDESNAFYMSGTDEPVDNIHITTGIIPAQAIVKRAKAKHVSVTAYLTAVLTMALQEIQKERVPEQNRRKPLKVCVPVNLRQFYDTRTMRNFSNYANVGIEPRYGEYTFDEALHTVQTELSLFVTEKRMNARFSNNVRSELMPALRVAPLFLKNFVMRMTYDLVGDCKTTTSFSNLGLVELPWELKRYVTRMDFILGPYLYNRVILAGMTYRNRLILNFTRTIKESALEREFFRFLVKQGVPVKIESNRVFDE